MCGALERLFVVFMRHLGVLNVVRLWGAIYALCGALREF